MRIDTHLHAYASAADGLHDLTAYPIVEYGAKGDVRFAGVAGTVEDALAALDAAGVDFAAVLASYELPGLPFPAGGARHWPSSPARPDLAPALAALNEWHCALAERDARLLPFVTTNPAVLTSEQSREHLSTLFSDRGARGMKLHPIAIRTFPDDPGLEGAYDALEAFQAPIVFHCGPDTRGFGWSQPEHFARLASRRPDLRLVLAHLGGASWREIRALADARPAVMFDLSEIVQWIGAPLAPSAEEVVGLIRAVGVERVMLGSDFPWYSPADTIASVESLPGLGSSERDAVLGENAARLLSLA